MVYPREDYNWTVTPYGALTLKFERSLYKFQGVLSLLAHMVIFSVQAKVSKSFLGRTFFRASLLKNTFLKYNPIDQ